MIDFFNTGAETTVNIEEFGICDENTAPYSCLSFDSVNKRGWIAVIKNPDRVELIHTPVDKCLDLRRTNGELDNRCDSLLYKQKQLVFFIELKERTSSGWVADAVKQLEVTIFHFKQNHPVEDAVIERKEARPT